MTAEDVQDRPKPGFAGEGLMTLALGGALVLVLAVVGIEITRAAGNVASIWLANIAALGVVLRSSGLMRHLALLMSGTAILIANLLYGDQLSVALGLSAANLIEIGLAWALLGVFRFRREAMQTTRGFLQFLAIAGLAAPLAGAATGALVLNQLVSADFEPVFRTWLLSACLGAVILGPSAVAPTSLGDARPLRMIEVLVWSAVSGVLLWLSGQPAYEFVIFLTPALVVFAGIRLGITASGTVGAALSLYVAWQVASGVEGLAFSDRLIDAQVFLFSSIGLSHIVALLWQQRMSAEARMRNYVRAFEEAEEGMFISGPEDEVVVYNRAAERIFPPIRDMDPGGRLEFREENMAMMARLRSGESVRDFHIRRPVDGGRFADLVINASPIVDDDGYAGSVFVFRDETENRRLRSEATARAAEIEALIGATSDGVIGTDADGVIHLWNRGAEKFYGRTTSEMIGTNVLDLPSGLPREQRARNLEALRNGENIRDRVTIVSPKDGQARRVALSINPVFDSMGVFAGCAVTLQDLTELIETLSQRDAAELRLEGAFDAITEAITIFDADECLVTCNEAYVQMVGASNEEELIGDNWEAILRRNIRDGLIDGVDDVEDYILARRRLREAGGEPYTMLLGNGAWQVGRDFPLPDGGFITVRQDITELKRAEAALALSNRELEQFAFVASHDLQEPLRKITNFGGLLVEEEAERLSDDGRMYLDHLIGSAERMQNLIRSLLAYSRLRDVSLEGQLHDLGELARLAEEDIEVALEEAQGEITIGRLGRAVVQKEDMIRVFQNLFGNAIKFRKPDLPPSIRVEAVPHSEDWVAFAVSDNGIGFDMQYADQVLQPFKRLHSHAEIPGSGMGLAIVAKVVRNHGGSINVESAPGEGSVITIALPKQPE